jgi:hypothetical protein
MMTTEEFAEKAGLSKHQLHAWLESGLLEAKMVNGLDGPRQEFEPHHPHPCRYAHGARRTAFTEGRCRI